MEAYRESTDTFDALDGNEIFYRSYAAKTERARMVILHGLGEHSGRYANIVDPLLAEGVSIWAPDHRGHGKSGGRRGHVARFNDYVEDLHPLISMVRKDVPDGRRCILLGHSMGGLIAARYAQQHGDSIDALILSSPALGMIVAVPPVKKLLARFTSALYPGLSMGNELDAAKISHDGAVVRAYRQDPLVHDRVSARWFTEFVAAIEAANGGAGSIRMPVLMQVAGDDHLVSAPASRQFFDRLAAADKTFHCYQGLYHEIYNAPLDDRNIVLKDLVSWVHARVNP
jgi:alpha-beta hydrolase superfamily lysophospholipase